MYIYYIYMFYIYIFIYVYMCVYTFLYVYMCVYICIYMCEYIYMYLHIYIGIFTTHTLYRGDGSQSTAIYTRANSPRACVKALANTQPRMAKYTRASFSKISPTVTEYIFQVTATSTRCFFLGEIFLPTFTNCVVYK